MEASQPVQAKLTELNIPFEIVNHPPAMTTAEADSYIKGISGVRTKSMFLTNRRKSAYYLLIMDDQKHLDMHKFAEIVDEKRLHLASSASLMEKMKLAPGIVSPFGLLNNVERDVQVYFDKDIVDEQRMSFHPNTNEQTIFLATTDLFKFIEAVGFEYRVVEL
ncbi:prolyl-tRNA synthetase associated domain-containing protein [Pediococcus acidilactici]|uniref:prolyl-tRNA synthetase associated domain-containing protein n=1 Tax=Pediococcus acidilactici TaxID=1254 RepID=UPI000FFB80C6|nr:prolyl-tRNA synthetase associated domain-containing protein [Pediococcus acidilactici]MBW4797628.1 prolyl-tRNA synthetase associated domain-containing protein [Pediococcus acidilactici]MBW9306410.1 prolyl-tRNA synthetase associated domain-containing protein [Pediococcus acidilactici]MCE5961939.1 prolyl-tRNA synthetase associated domain-containing protein [Pediococcus acidilactici]MCW8083049.1 prolyl-tRNA synthetase associated domain-containing protein [Pediococcus acidilactici]MDB8857154.1 